MEALTTPVGRFVVGILYLIAASGFIVGLKLMGGPKTARQGNMLGAAGMALAAILTLMAPGVWDFTGIIGAMVVGGIVGLIAARTVKMTEMPQMVAIFNGFGGAASVLVAAAEFQHYVFAADQVSPVLFTITGGLSVIIGAITLTGSFIAFAKLQEIMTTAPITYPGQQVVNGAAAVAMFVLLFMLLGEGQSENVMFFWGMTALAAILGVTLVIPIGGADMPVVISLLNSYSGIAACAAGFVVGSNALIISGSLVGAAGIILTRQMCQAMNRSLANVIFGAFGAATAGPTGEAGEQKPWKEFQPIDAAMLLTNANNVIVVPGYGLAVSQAQQNVREIAEMLEGQDVTVKYAIHPVAGRMPGHMNVLLAEANVPYELLYDLDDINSEFENAEVAVVIGANDVVNPSAREDKDSPLYGMPVLNADKAATCIVLKRGRGRGFAGVDNPLFSADNTGLVYGDAKKTLTAIANEIKTL